MSNVAKSVEKIGPDEEAVKTAGQCMVPNTTISLGRHFVGRIKAKELMVIHKLLEVAG